MEIKPASLDQIIRGKNGRMIAIDNDVGNVAKDLHDLDSSLKLRYSEAGEYFVVYQEFQNSDGSSDQYLVTTSQTCDQRLVYRVREIMHPDYDLEAELKKTEQDGWAKIQEKIDEDLVETGQRLAHAARKDVGYENVHASQSKKTWGKGKKLRGIVGS